jgi:hypothetical protein
MPGHGQQTGGPIEQAYRNSIAQGKTMMPPMLNELALAQGFATLQQSLVCLFIGEFHV